MFKEMRRKEKQLIKIRALEILKQGEYGVLATVGENGYPYALPMNYVFFNERIYLHGAKKGHKIENINYNNKVSFAVVGDYELQPAEFTTHYESVVIFGKARSVEGEIKKKALQQFIMKYSADFKSEGFDYIKKVIRKTKIIEIEIKDVKGKKSS